MEEELGSPGGTLAGSPALGANAAGAAPDLAVHVQEACVVTPGLLCADLWEGHRQEDGPVWQQGPLPCPSQTTPGPGHSQATW